MALPIQPAPKYKTTLPFSKEEVEYRPFLVKEQKILMIAQESEDQTQILDSIKELLKSVTDNKVDPNDLTAIDMEWLFLKVRTVSIGETSTLMIKCDDCNFATKVDLDLNSVKIEGEVPENDAVMINSEVGVKLSLPSVETLQNITKMEQSLQLFTILKSCMVQIFDSENVYHCKELDQEDLDEFVESLTFQQLGTLGQFFDGAPKAVLEADFTCESCNKKQLKKLEGIQSFF